MSSQVLLLDHPWILCSIYNLVNFFFKLTACKQVEVIFKFLLNIGWTILVILENIFLLNMLKLIENFPTWISRWRKHAYELINNYFTNFQVGTAFSEQRHKNLFRKIMTHWYIFWNKIKCLWPLNCSLHSYYRLTFKNKIISKWKSPKKFISLLWY